MTYDYECPDCKHVWEEEQSIKDDPIQICPKCKKKNVIKVISCGVGHLFAGKGKYKGQYYKDAKSSWGDFS